MNAITRKLAALTAAVVFSLTAIGAAAPAHAQEAPVTTPAPTNSDAVKHPRATFALARHTWDALMDSASKAIGMSREDIRKDMIANGLSLKGVVLSKGGNANEIENAAKAKVRAEIDQALADGKITRKQADVLREHVDAVADREYNRVPRPRPAGAATPVPAQ